MRVVRSRLVITCRECGKDVVAVGTATSAPAAEAPAAEPVPPAAAEPRDAAPLDFDEEEASRLAVPHAQEEPAQPAVAVDPFAQATEPLSGAEELPFPVDEIEAAAEVPAFPAGAAVVPDRAAPFPTGEPVSPPASAPTTTPDEKPAPQPWAAHASRAPHDDRAPGPARPAASSPERPALTTSPAEAPGGSRKIGIGIGVAVAAAAVGLFLFLRQQPSPVPTDGPAPAPAPRTVTLPAPSAAPEPTAPPPAQAAALVAGPTAPAAPTAALPGPTKPPAATPRPANLREEDALAKGIVDGEAFRSAAGKIPAYVKMCGRLELAREGGTKVSSLALTLVVPPSGGSAQVKLEKGIDGTPLGDCLRSELGKISFPSFTGTPIELKRTISLE